MPLCTPQPAQVDAEANAEGEFIPAYEWQVLPHLGFNMTCTHACPDGDALLFSAITCISFLIILSMQLEEDLLSPAVYFHTLSFTCQPLDALTLIFVRMA